MNISQAKQSEIFDEALLKLNNKVSQRIIIIIEQTSVPIFDYPGMEDRQTAQNRVMVCRV
jgi:hypothetical protein